MRNHKTKRKKFYRVEFSEYAQNEGTDKKIGFRNLK